MRPHPRLTSTAFGETHQGHPVRLWQLRNAAGATVSISELGAAIVSVQAPDRNGTLADVTLGFDTAEAYSTDRTYLGVLVGRYANRIAGAKFTLDGKTHHLIANDRGNTLHGGTPGLHTRLWCATPSDQHEARLQLTLSSPNGEGGFPGQLDITTEFQWSDDFVLSVQIEAMVSVPTPLSLTHHTYWNMAGHGSASVRDHTLKIAAGHYLPVTSLAIPTGQIAPITNTAFDFQSPKSIGEGLAGNDPQIQQANGYDHAFVLNGHGLRPAAWLSDPASGRQMTILTDQPAMQFYSLNALQEPLRGKGGARYCTHSAVALETQAFPNAPNEPAFPQAIARPGEMYRSTTHFAFGILSNRRDEP